MKDTIQISLVALLLLGATSCTTNHPEKVSNATHPDRFKSAVPEIDIPPPTGHRMAGYYDERLATGTHDPLKAKALVLRQGNEQVSLVFCDLVGVSLHVTTNARARASLKTGIPITNIVIAATHSHTGPLFDDVRRHYFHEAALAKYGKNPQETIYYPDFLSARLVQV